jgi:bifunctional non-homologous end joining protein LigD
VPIRRTLRFDEVRAVARTISERLLHEHPREITTEWDIASRRGKVFLDYNMNVRGKSIIVPFGPRGLSGAPVSMPLTWRNLATAVPADFRIAALLERMPRSDPWSSLLEAKQELAEKFSRM